MIGRFVIRLGIFAALLWVIFWFALPAMVGGYSDMAAGAFVRLLALAFGGALAIVLFGMGLGWVFGATPAPRR